MPNRPPHSSAAAPLVVLLAIVLLLLGAYAGGYLYMGDVRQERLGGSVFVEPIGNAVEEYSLLEITRVFPRSWQLTFFRPAATIEGWLRRIEVKTMDEEAWNIEIATDGT
jgi:hypothetical protein